MVTFRNNSNNNRRSNFRRNDRGYKPNGERKFSSNFSNNDNFKRKSPGRNNHNAAKLIEKYNDLAREASSNGDKILSENYLQHADHFTRILNERESFKRQRFSENRSEDNNDKLVENNNNLEQPSEKEVVETSNDEKEISKSLKSQPEVN